MVATEIKIKRIHIRGRYTCIVDEKPPTATDQHVVRRQVTSRIQLHWQAYKIRSAAKAEPRFRSHRRLHLAPIYYYLLLHSYYQRTMPSIIDNALGAVGHTPLIRLDKIAQANDLKCNLCESILSVCQVLSLLIAV